MSPSTFRVVPSAKQELSSTQSGDSIVPVEVDPQNNYNLIINLSESFDLDEESFINVSTTAAVFPIYVYNGYINLLFPDEISNITLEYRESRKDFFTIIEIPHEMNYSTINGTISHEFDQIPDNFYYLLWISVRDSEGGTNEFQILLIPSGSSVRWFNLVPVLLLISVIGIGVYVIEKINKRKQKQK